MHYTANDFNPLRDDLGQDAQDAINRTMAEIMGLKMGWCGGRGGSMHLFDAASGNLGSNAIVGGGIPLATGAGLAERMLKRDSIVVSIFGDGAFNQGCFHEVANMASIWDVPILYLIENNGYAVATNICEASCCTQLALRGLGYNFDTTVLDGMDPIGMYTGLSQVIENMRKNPGPHMIEAMTYRYTHHAGSLPGSQFGYRNEAEEAEWKEKDPVVGFAQTLIGAKVISKKDNENIQEKVMAMMEEAMSFGTNLDGDKRFIPSEYWPESDSLIKDVRSENAHMGDTRFIEREQASDVKRTTYVEAIAAVTNRHFEKDERVMLMGEEVGHFLGGAYSASKGAKRRFPDRVFDTPISEAGFVGMGGGAACVGMRPIVEIMFPDFALVAADQLFNQIGKLRHMYGGQVNFPLVLRTRVALGQGYGGQHSMNPAGFFGMFSGWRVVAPSTPFDYIGLFNTAMKFEDPVVIIEHADLYDTEGDIPKDSLDYFVAYGKSKILRSGDAMTILTYSSTVLDALKAAEKLSAKGIETELIDLRTIDYQGMDYDAIYASVKKTGRVLVVEQNPRSLGISARLADEIQERCFAELLVPVARLTAADVPPPVSKAMEAMMMVTAEEIEAKAEAVMRQEVAGRTAASQMVSASPLAKKVAERMAVDLDKVTGTGPRGKIYKADVIVTAREPEAVKSDDEPAVDEAGRPSQLVPFNSMRQAIASRMSSSKFTAPHLYFFTDVNMDKVIAFKNELSAGLPGDVRISINDIFIKLTALALKEFPNLNATVEKDAIRLWDQINIGLAVALEDGLIVPAIPEADELRFPEIANYRKELIDKARHGKLSPEEMSRGTFTISSLAKSGITHFTAIINPPQTAILSIGPAQEKAIVEDGELRTGRMATFGLSVDHRVIDGKVAADFLSRLKDLLENAKHRLMLYY